MSNHMLHLLKKKGFFSKEEQFTSFIQVKSFHSIICHIVAVTINIIALLFLFWEDHAFEKSGLDFHDV